MDRYGSQRSRLKSEIEQYSNLPASPSKAVGITLRYPTYSDLTQDQLSYYTYWKSTIGQKMFRKIGEGYTWLLVCELLNSSDRSKSSEILNCLVSPRADGSGPAYPELLETAIEFSQYFGTPMPECSEWVLESPALMPFILTSPVSDLPAKIISDAFTDTAVTEDLVNKVGEVLRIFDVYLQKKHGTSLKEALMVPAKICRLPFSDYILLGPKHPVELIRWEFREKDILSRLIREVVDRIMGRDTGSSRITGSEFLGSIIESVNACPVYGPSPDPLSKNGNDFRILGTAIPGTGPSCFHDIITADNSGSRITLGDVLSFSPPETPVHAEFVTSDYEHPTYNDLSRNQFAYYTYWKNCFRMGRYLDTDNGYLNLFLTELVNSNDTAGSRRMLYKLHEVYGGTGLTGITIVDHAICNGTDIPGPEIYLDRMTSNKWVEAFVNGRDCSPLTHTMLSIMRTGTANVNFTGSDVPLEIMEISLRRMFAQIRSKADPDKVFSVEKKSGKRSIYFGLNYMRGPSYKIVDVLDFIGSRKFISFVDKAVRYAAEIATAHDKGEAIRKKPFNVSGVNCAGILSEELLVWWSSKIRPAEVKLDLDLDAIMAAESDLAQVIEMMRVEEIVEEEEIVEPAKTEAASDDPWAAFCASLTDDERRYLELCISGSGAREYLRERGITGVKMDDAINAKALDTVGDTVIEGGQPVEDYLEELEKGL